MTLIAVPVTVLTGFLGSGKTTLINRILREQHGRRFAIIENEFGEIGVDAQLIYRDGTETIVELANGCVCCSVRGDLVRALTDLATRRDANAIAFDHVLIEASGMADPGPVIRTFLAETALLTKYYLDGVVALVDALHAHRYLDTAPEAQAQIGYADRILLTKADAAPADRVDALAARVAHMNAGASVRAIDVPRAPWGEVFEDLFEVKGYQFDRVRFEPLAPEPAAAHSEHVVSVAFSADQELDAAALDRALLRLKERYPDTLWRVKGVLAVRGSRRQLVVQGVQGLVQIHPGTIWRPYEPRRSRLVIIGRDLDPAWIQAELRACVPADVSGTSRARPD
ncbi:MAG: GTP-binding protein [Gammaproteobacteria bacterium]|nr:GTP-binding protein [Gammaproteobacteria bacterium]